jgi:2-haloacid dehalogenase
MKLGDFTTLTFDCYGTLIDWESGMLQALGPVTQRASRKLTVNELLEAHARHESAQQLQTPAMRYSELLAVVCKRIAEEWGIAVTWKECLAYGSSVKDWPAFPDTVEALKYLKKHFKLVILSNVDNESFSASAERLQVAFDAVYTAQEVGSYKPSDRNFNYMIQKLSGLGVTKGQILHTAESLFHDHSPANKHGIASCWIHRRYDKEGFGATMNPGTMPKFSFRFTSLGEFAEAHRRETSQ